MHPRRLLNPSEHRAFEQLEKGLEPGRFHISKKVPVKDAIYASPAEIREFSEARRRLWWTGHFDLACTNTETDAVEFVVEYDGPLHADPSQERRDRAKNGLCRNARIPILRIDCNTRQLTEFEETSVVEYMARLFCAWKLEGQEVTRWWEGIMAANPGQEDPGPSFHFHLRHPFPPKQAIFDRLFRRLYFGASDVDSDGDLLDANGNPCLQFDVSPGRCEPGKRCEYTGIVRSRSEVLFKTRRGLTYNWMLPVDDEKHEVIAGCTVPVHRPGWSELPGASVPYVMAELAEYFVIKDIEGFVLERLDK